MGTLGYPVGIANGFTSFQLGKSFSIVAILGIGGVNMLWIEDTLRGFLLGEIGLYLLITLLAVIGSPKNLDYWIFLLVLLASLCCEGPKVHFNERFLQ